AARDRRAAQQGAEHRAQAPRRDREAAELRLLRAGLHARATARDQPRRPRALAQVRQGGGNPAGVVAKRFDAIVVGAGQAGPALAARLSAAGRKVAMIERDKFGGTCVNDGCTPTKTL